eukprot:741863_1
MAAGHVNSLTLIQYNSTALAGVSNHSINFFYQMFDSRDAEPNIKDQPNQFHTYSYQSLSDGIWYIISMVMVIVYVTSWFYPGFDDIENADVGFYYGVNLVLNISIIMVLTKITKSQRRGLNKIQMVLFIYEIINELINKIINKICIITIRKLYGCLNGNWLIKFVCNLYMIKIIKYIYLINYTILMNNKLFIILRGAKS